MKRSIPLLLSLGLAVGCVEDVDTAQTDPGADDTGEAVDIDWGFDVGQTAPDFTLSNAEGETVNLSDYRGGRVAIIGTAAW